MKFRDTDTYTALAALYDTLMGDVDYVTWADFIDEIMQTHYPGPEKILELACGTGALSLELAQLECYDITATDKSEEMIEIARLKSKNRDMDIEFLPMNFLNLEFEDPFEIIFSVFDSVNYLHSGNEILKMLRETHNSLVPGGLLIFDFSTPQNSLEAVDYLNNEEGSSGNYRYFRESSYDPKQKFHYNYFEIERLADDGKTILNRYKEEHRQRIYTLNEMLSFVEQSPYNLVAKYDGFDLIDADESSARVTMVLKCQKQK